MSKNIENLKSVLKIRILANTTETTLYVNYFKKSLRNLQALYVLRNSEKFENSIKIHFFILEIAAKFQQFSRKQHKRGKAPIDLMLHMHLPVTQSCKTA